MKAYLFHCRNCDKFHLYYDKNPSNCKMCNADASLLDELENVAIQINLAELVVGTCPTNCVIRGTMWCNPSCRHWEQEHGAY